MAKGKNSHEDIQIPGDRGLLAASVHYPAASGSRLAVLCPGYLDSKDYRHLVALAEDLAAEGYVVVRFDPTGTWGSEGDISAHTVSQYLRDVKRVIEHMEETSDTAYRNILVGGHSRGGLVALLYAARDSRVEMVLGIAPASGKLRDFELLDEWQKDDMRISERDLPNQKEVTREFRVPWSYAVDSAQHDGLLAVKEIRGPVILVVGEEDDAILPEEVRGIYDSAIEPKSFTIIPAIGHGYRHNEDEIKIVNAEIMKQILIYNLI